MYHIKPDRRSQASAAQIVQGLQECLKNTPLKAVTVSDIHRVTGISRATFYRLFDTPEDVLVYQLDQMTENAKAVYENQNHQSTARLLEETISLGLQNYEFLQALVQNGRHDLLYQYTEKNFRKLDSVKAIFLRDMDDLEREYVISHLSMSMVAALVTWYRNGRQNTPGDLIRYMRSYVRVVSEMVGEE